MQLVHRSASNAPCFGAPATPSRIPANERPCAATAPAGWGHWLAGKVEEALEYRALQMRGGLPPARPTLQPTVLEAVGRLAANTGGRTLQVVAKVPPPPAEFLA